MLYDTVLVSVVHQSEQPYAYIGPHIPSLLSLRPILPIPPVYVIAKHQADLPVLCCCFPLANYFTFGSVYMLMLISLHPSFPLPPCILKSILYVYIFIPALHKYHFFFFRFPIYALTDGIFLFLTYFTLYDRL